MESEQRNSGMDFGNEFRRFDPGKNLSISELTNFLNNLNIELERIQNDTNKARDELSRMKEKWEQLHLLVLFFIVVVIFLGIMELSHIYYFK